LEKLAAAKKELAVLEKELSEYSACDPVKVEEKKRGVTLAKEAAVRWTGERCVTAPSSIQSRNLYKHRQLCNAAVPLHQAKRH
jgi:hypothetical protein